MFAFGAADSHLHVALACGRKQLGRFLQRLLCALRARLGVDVAFDVTRIRPFRDQWHRANDIGYVIRQALHHEIATDPWLEGSALPDILGLRPKGATLRETVLRVSPRLKPEALLLPLVGRRSLAEADEISLLAEATRAAALLPSLEGRDARVVEARRAAVAATAASTQAVAAALGISPRAVQHLRAQPHDPRLVTAIRLQMGLRSQPLDLALLEAARERARVKTVREPPPPAYTPCSSASFANRTWSSHSPATCTAFTA
ncbi:MAG: hypothetical protein ACOZNI_12820 [Myxococcota bacterium]